MCAAGVAEGQPFTLDILGSLFGHFRDCDADLPQRGVPTGIESDIPPPSASHSMKRPERPCLGFSVHDEPWLSASHDPECLMRPVQADIDAGFAKWLPGGLAEAKARFGTKCAAGGLGSAVRTSVGGR